jgi:NAD(P)H-flavin reductase
VHGFEVIRLILLFQRNSVSIASSPQFLPKLRLIIREAGDCTNAFGAIEPGRRVAIDGPHRGFILRSSGAHVVIIAGGVGVAPLVGMLEEAANSGDARAFRLLYVGRTPGSLAGLLLIESLSQRLDLRVVKVVDALAEPPAFEQGPIGRGHIEEILSGFPAESDLLPRLRTGRDDGDRDKRPARCKRPRRAYFI